MLTLWLKLQLLLAVSSALADPCKITLPTDVANPQPVIVTQEGLLRPTNAVTEIAENDKITLHCAGKGNMLVALSEQTAKLECQSGSFYDEETGKEFALNKLNCTHIPTAEVLVTEIACANGTGLLHEVGFAVNDEFQSLFTICYNRENVQTLYSRNLLNGRGLDVKIIDSTRRSFRAEGMRFTTTAINNLYTTKNQIARFKTLFGADQAYVNRTSFLARGHLTPDADFIFTYEQLATYFYINCAPEWQVVNAGNWLRVENLARKLASSLGSDLLTFTSTLGKLELENSKSGDSEAIYLDKTELISAPQWYYKVLMHPELPVDLVIITLNDPFANVDKTVEFCTNVCDKYGLADSSVFQVASHGYTFCCELNDFWENAMDTDTPYYDLPEGWSYKSN
ncbi:uncharacterized protein LOC118744768 [Rhagoletis pomonella]|uniref:uncharacterized protein LOC118744768 n=1 Tax=Rhagoletis pomonella TaxID=28610 RepID=UPI00177F3052|nr:uncharacterized protein LOC118744768 [Rhagoletis pomonella]